MIGKTFFLHDVKEGDIAKIRLRIDGFIGTNREDLRHRQLLAVKMFTELNERVVFRDIGRVIGEDITVFSADYPEVGPVGSCLF